MKVVLHNPFRGKGYAESELGIRMVNAFAAIGHKAIEASSVKEINRFDPAFVLSMHPTIAKVTKYPTYGCMWSPPPHYSEWGDDIKANIRSYDGYFYGSKATSDWTAELVSHSGKAASMGLLVPSCNATIFAPGERLRSGKVRIAYFGKNWDGDRHRSLFEQLANEGFMDFYGPPDAWRYLKSGYKGLVPFNGRAVVETYRIAGAGIFLHSDQHTHFATPSMRIFEIVAAGAVAICGRHGFIEDMFGDSVLYIDIDSRPEEQVECIRRHLLWINENNGAALKIAARAHAIFAGYSLECLFQGAVQSFCRQGGRHVEPDLNLVDRPRGAWFPWFATTLGDARSLGARSIARGMKSFGRVTKAIRGND